MSILTPKMKYSRDLTNASPNLVCWFPFNEASGNVITDVIGGITITDDGTATYLANCITFTATGTVTSGTLPALAQGKSLIMIDVIQSGALAGAGDVNTCGSSNSFYGMSAQATVRKSGQTQTTAAFQTLTNNEKFVRMMTFDGVTGVLNAYSGNDGVACALDNTADASAHIGGISPAASTWSIGSSALGDVETYGILIYHVDSLPSEAALLEAADFCYDNWTVGKKYLPPSIT